MDVNFQPGAATGRCVAWYNPQPRLRHQHHQRWHPLWQLLWSATSNIFVHQILFTRVCKTIKFLLVGLYYWMGLFSALPHPLWIFCLFSFCHQYHYRFHTLIQIWPLSWVRWSKLFLFFSDVAQVQVLAAQHASQAHHQQGGDANGDLDDNNDDPSIRLVGNIRGHHLTKW